MRSEGTAANRAPDPDRKKLCMNCMQTTYEGGLCCACGWQGSREVRNLLHLPAGSVLENRYHIGRVLGQGGFGITYLSYDAQQRRRVAIKEYFPQSVASRASDHSRVVSVSDRVRPDFEYGLQRFLEEARILSMFQEHPCIVTVFDIFQANGTGYMVMEYLSGVTCREYLAGSGHRIPFDLALRIMMPVLDGLREVHSRSLLHRDVSPDNIFITRAKRIILIDFGAARFSVGERSQNLSVILKPGYAPEEQYRQRSQQGPATDIYAAAATLYRAITGEAPPDSLERLSEDTLQPPSLMGVDIRPFAERALLKGLAVRAADRYQTVQAFQRALTSEQAARPIAAASDDYVPAGREKPYVTTPRRSPWPLLAFFLACAIVIIVSLVITGRAATQSANVQQRPAPQNNLPAPAPKQSDSAPSPFVLPQQQQPIPQRPSEAPAVALAGKHEAQSFSVSYPDGWTVHSELQSNHVVLAPPGGFSQQGNNSYVTAGVALDYITTSESMTLEQFTENILTRCCKAFPNYRHEGQESKDGVLVTQVSLTSIHGAREINRIVAVRRSDGFFLVQLVGPATEFNASIPVFMKIIESISLK